MHLKKPWPPLQVANCDPSPGREPAIILVVEDEVLIRLMIANELRTAGFTVIEAASADEAVAVLNISTKIDVLMTDIRMPGSMDGVELAALAHSTWPRIKIIVASAYNPYWPTSVIIDAFVGKPCNPDRLIDVIKELLSKGSQ